MIWNYLNGKLSNPVAAAGLMGNLYAESGLESVILEYAQMKRLGFNSAEYTVAVDSGEYHDFAKDAAGYGIAQWTWGPRKKALLEYAVSKGTSVGDLDMQLEFLWIELNNSYSHVLNKLNNARTIRDASDIVIDDFECPADKSENVRVTRASYGEGYYQKYALNTDTCQ